MAIQASATQLILGLTVYTEDSGSIVTTSAPNCFKGRAARSVNNGVHNRLKFLVIHGHIMGGGGISILSFGTDCHIYLTTGHNTMNKSVV
jgi:hypothetical protein